MNMRHLCTDRLLKASLDKEELERPGTRSLISGYGSLHDAFTNGCGQGALEEIEFKHEDHPVKARLTFCKVVRFGFLSPFMDFAGLFDEQAGNELMNTREAA